MGNAAGLIRVGYGGAVPIGVFTGASQSGPLSMYLDGKGFASWNFQLKGTVTTGGVTVQGTTDGVNFFDLAPDGVNTTTGSNVNPIVSLDAQIRYKGPLYGVRGVSTSDFTGSVTLLGFATP